jgi:hypothetical protein
MDAAKRPSSLRAAGASGSRLSLQAGKLSHKPAVMERGNSTIRTPAGRGGNSQGGWPGKRSTRPGGCGLLPSIKATMDRPSRSTCPSAGTRWASNREAQTERVPPLSRRRGKRLLRSAGRAEVGGDTASCSAATDRADSTRAIDAKGNVDLRNGRMTPTHTVKGSLNHVSIRPCDPTHKKPAP